jgi:ribosome-associated heat shock protein Hsp15
MRLDQWLWAVRLFKSRALAASAIRAGFVRLEGRSPKPSSEVRPGQSLDVCSPTAPGQISAFTILALPTGRVSAKKVSEFLTLSL